MKGFEDWAKDFIGDLWDIVSHWKLTKASDNLAAALTGEKNSLKEQTDREIDILGDKKTGLNGNFATLSKDIDDLCTKLQNWIEKCGCSGAQQTSAQVVIQFPIGFTYAPGGTAGQLGDAPSGLANTAPPVSVEVHNYGPQNEAGSRNPGGRDLHQMVGESVAKDMKRGGPAAIAIKHAFGVERQPIQR